MKVLDTVAACRELRRRLNSEEVTIDHAHAEARILGVESRAIEAAIDAARLTGRLAQGQESIPDTGLGEDHD
jgi:hypothetical protein